MQLNLETFLQNASVGVVNKSYKLLLLRFLWVPYKFKENVHIQEKLAGRTTEIHQIQSENTIDAHRLLL